MATRLFALIFVGSSLLPLTTAPAPPVDTASKAAAAAMVNRFVDSWNRADGAAYGENYWPEAEVVDPSGGISTGRAAIVQQHVELWSGIFKGSRIKAAVRRIQVLCPDHMIVDFDAELFGIRAAAGGQSGGCAGHRQEPPEAHSRTAQRGLEGAVGAEYFHFAGPGALTCVMQQPKRPAFDTVGGPP